MSLDPILLEQAQSAGARLADAEHEALLARADYHTAIRRLHLAGAPLREIAETLSLSHQRVQQVVSAAGGSWWQVLRRRRPSGDAVCTWCEKPPGEVSKLIAGPQVYICDACVVTASQAMGSGNRRRNGFQLTTTGRHRCDFCRKRASDTLPIVKDRANVCADCLRVCREILDSRAL